MYSVMLAAMLTTTSATPEWGCHGCYGCSGCHSCYGCSGYTYCHGCCGGCYGYSCNAFSWGCSCYGCGCSGCSCYGCWGCGGCSCSGFFCSGSYLGGPSFQSVGGCACTGPSFSVFSHVPYYSSCCCGCCGGCFGCSCCGCCGGIVVSPPPAVDEKPAAGGSAAATAARIKALEEELRALKERMPPGQPGGVKPPRKPANDEANDLTAAPAHVVIKLPADARLFVDDQPCPLTSDTRSFDTPELRPGEVYFYTIRAEVVRNGKPVTASRRATLRAGKETVVEFGDLAPRLTAGR